MTSHIEEQAPKAVTPKQSWRGTLTGFARRNGLQIGIVFVLLLIWVFFVFGAPETFLSPEIYAAYMSTIPFFAVMALPLTMVIIAGEIDLSFPSIMAIGMVTFVNVFAMTNSVTAAFLLSLIVGFLVGLLNGVIVVKLGIPSLVATIGTQFFWRGAVLVITGGQPTSLVVLRGTFLQQVLVGRVANYIPAQMIWTVVVAIVVFVSLSFVIPSGTVQEDVEIVSDPSHVDQSI